MQKRYLITGLFLICAGLFCTCSDPFSFGPFEARVKDSFLNTTDKNLIRIRQIDTTSNRPFSVALVSDSHYHFKDLEDAVADINQKDTFSLIIVTGDLTENGLLKEFEIFHQIMNRSTIPYLTVIGNHDHLANGAAVYQQMFGPLNYSFTFHHVKFVAWDNTIWESEKEADYQWLNETLKIKNDNEQHAAPYHHTVVLSHIPPFDRQLLPKKDVFHNLLKEHHVKLSVHGHKHEFFLDEWLGDGIRYMTVGSPQNRNYAALYITPSEITVNKIDY